MGVRSVYVDDRIAKPVSLRRFLPRGQNDILLPYSVDGMAWLKRACVLLRPRLLRQTENFYLHALRAELDAPPGCPVGDGPTPPRFALAAFDIVETPWFMTRFPTTSGIWSARFPPPQTGGAMDQCRAVAVSAERSDVVPLHQVVAGDPSAQLVPVGDRWSTHRRRSRRSRGV